jgi:NAD(P)H-flavin reductase
MSIDSATVATAASSNPMMPVRYVVRDRVEETADTVTLALEPVDDPIVEPAPGQFTMLYAFGAGEAAISVSGCPRETGALTHTIRVAGPTTRALARLGPGAMLGVRGPFGRGWPVEQAGGGDVLVVAGGLGLAPLRPIVHDVIAARDRFGSVGVLIGGRTPLELLYRSEVAAWRDRGDLGIAETVDAASRTWTGRVGLVTALLDHAPSVSAHTTAYLCGPEVMMRVVARRLVDDGMDPERVFVSLERNMHCAVRLCGHCQLGPVFVCADGPVLPWARVAPLLAVRRW